MRYTRVIQRKTCHSERSRGIPLRTLKAIPRDPSTSLRSAQDDSESLIINPIHLPSSPCHAIALRRRVGFMSTKEFSILHLQVPLGAYPRFFVPPISGKQIRTVLFNDFLSNFRAANMRGDVFIQQH